MSEEEILKQLDNACILDKNCYEVDYLFEKDLEAIRSLLDLYNEEKEKNASLEKEIKLMKSININDNYISKDKIKEIIEVIKETVEEDKIFSKDEIREEIQKLKALDEKYYSKLIKVLEELLEE